MTLKVLVIGTGAVGSFYGAALQKGGASVSVVARSDYNHVRDHGIQIKSATMAWHFIPDHVFSSFDEVSFTPDYILIATKVLPETSLKKMIGPSVSNTSSLVLLQNGIRIENPVREDFPNNEIISGLAFICVTRTSPGIIEHADYGKLVLGPWPQGNSKKAEKLAEIFTAGGVETTVSDDTIRSRWEKLVWNAPFNPMSVLAGGASTAEMLGNENSLRAIKDVMKEVIALSYADGHPVDPDLAEKMIAFTEVMIPYKTSMLKDYEAKRPMEVEAILGNAVRFGQSQKVPIPHLTTLYGLLSLADRLNINR